jgi:hypothetical protein
MLSTTFPRISNKTNHQRSSRSTAGGIGHPLRVSGMVAVGAVIAERSSASAVDASMWQRQRTPFWQRQRTPFCLPPLQPDRSQHRLLYEYSPCRWSEE